MGSKNSKKTLNKKVSHSLPLGYFSGIFSIILYKGFSHVKDCDILSPLHEYVDTLFSKGCSLSDDG